MAQKTELPVVSELLMRIGMTLMHVQNTELILRKFVIYYLRDQNASWDDILAEDEKRRRHSLGKFLVEMRKRIFVEPTFDEALIKFLGDRNIFAHNLGEIPGFRFTTQEGIQAGVEFLKKLEKQADHVRKVLVGYMTLGVRTEPDYDPNAPATEMDAYQVIAAMSLTPKE